MPDFRKPYPDRFLPGIHGLRAVAALSVLLFHHAAALDTLSIPSFAKPITIYGGFGVPLFFVLSAFSLAHSTYDRMRSHEWVREFVLRRFFRIAPMFYLMIIIFVLHDYYTEGKIYSICEITINIMFVYGFVPGKHESIVLAGWTVGIEMMFYALFPAMLTMVRGLITASGFFLLSCVTAVSVVQELRQISGIDPSYFYENLCQSLPSFAAGLVAYYVIRLFRVSRLPSVWLVSGAAVTTCIGIFMAVNIPFDPSLRTDLYIWALAFSALAIWQAVAPSPLMSSRLLQFVGERSYSVYLVHAPIVFYLKPIYEEVYRVVPFGPVAYLSCVVLGIGCVLLAATSTYALVEAPGIRLGAALIRRRRAALASAAWYTQPTGTPRLPNSSMAPSPTGGQRSQSVV